MTARSPADPDTGAGLACPRGGRALPAIPVAMFAAAVIALAISLASAGHVNGAQTMATFAEGYGVHADRVTVGIGLLLGPGLVALFSCLSVTELVRTTALRPAAAVSRRCWPPRTSRAR